MASVSQKNQAAILAISVLALLLLASIIFGFDPEAFQRNFENFQHGFSETIESMNRETPSESLIPIAPP